MRFHFRNTVSVASFALSTLVSLNASAEKYQWKSADSPPPRSAAGLGYDRGRSRTVLFGGRGPSGTLNDTWEWDGLTWSPRAVASPPAARFNAQAFYDTTSKRVSFFGGQSVSTAFGDAWSWNGSSWSSVPFVGAQPPLRSGGVSSFDSKRNKWVMFSGIDSTGLVLNDTWELDAATRVWTKMSPATVPVGRQFAAMSFDPLRGVMVMTGGLNFATATQVLDDTWEWDGTNWVEPGYTGMSASEFAMVAYDEMRSKMVAFVPLSIILAGSPNPTFELDPTQKKMEANHASDDKSRRRADPLRCLRSGAEKNCHVYARCARIGALGVGWRRLVAAWPRSGAQWPRVPLHHLRFRQ